MKFLTNFITFCLLSSILLGQQAPDFTIIDTDGVTHSLYEDYLNQDQIVVIKIFFVSCPLCKPYAVDFQQLYEELGSGEDGVEFFLLSNKVWDNNEDVAAYQDEYGYTFPGAGEDGGGYDATEPYRSGYFGPFYGAPTFIVIAPDGTTYHGIEESSVSATMDAIQDKVNEIKLNAFSTEVQVDVNSYYGYDLPPYKLYLQSAGQNQNRYEVPEQFFYPSENYPEILNPELVLEIDTLVREHITTLDLVLMQRNLLGLVSFDNFQSFASDVNDSGSLSAGDLLAMRKFILRLLTQFPNQKSFFAFDDRCRDNKDYCTPIIPIETSGNLQMIKFTVMQYGDVRK